MRFKIVSTGWTCADWLEQTLKSVEEQSVDNWDIAVVYDPSDDDGAERIRKWCDQRDQRWQYKLNAEQKFAVRNQYEAIERLAPADDDVVVFLDLDGDRFAHKDVLAHLADYYADGTLLTYGSFEPVPPVASCGRAKEFPPEVIASNSYRTYLRTGDCCFNHLRTISGAVVNAIPTSQFKWPSGEFYDAGTDYIFMTAGLELAGGRHKFIPEVLVLYNHANPHADYLEHPAETSACVQDFLSKPPLKSLSLEAQEPPKEQVFLSAEERREVLREYGKRYGLKVLVETGTNDGGTPWTLKDDFEQLFTIELGERQWQAATERFAAYPKVTCLLGDSAVVLPELVQKLHEPALFWLDGHWSGGSTAHGPKDTPVIEELAAIFATKVPHVILVDDARLFEGMSHYGEHDWPHIDVIRKLAAEAKYSCEIRDDIVRLTP